MLLEQEHLGEKVVAISATAIRASRRVMKINRKIIR